MRWTFILTALIVGVACRGDAFAAAAPKVHDTHKGVPAIDRSDSGIIVALNADRRTITLGNGTTYSVPSYVDFGSLKAGRHVAVLYTYYLEKNTLTVKNVRLE